MFVILELIDSESSENRCKKNRFLPLYDQTQVKCTSDAFRAEGIHFSLRVYLRRAGHKLIQLFVQLPLTGSFRFFRLRMRSQAFFLFLRNALF